ncbi:glycosyltransferase [uncultured Dokdonia sp.]|uniref:glycosyltransferase n=1 Tax=uncultured Dokdonia sp. TaxID=575653 RepID=UPI0026394022|nr:glycosyltransferase [uncultured Dokdonia sp.]
MNSIHFRRWVSQLEDSNHEIYWFDIKDQGYISSLSWVNQITNWKKRILKKKGRYFIKRKLPYLYKKLSNVFDIPVETAFSNALREIQPDVVHSFALFIGCKPILSVMEKNKNIPWLYSSWGSDIYFRDNKLGEASFISQVCKRLDYAITDCDRDKHILIKEGFVGEHLGVFPGGGGYPKHMPSKKERKKNSFIIKGYQDEHGRALPVIKALLRLKDKGDTLSIFVFGVSDEFYKLLEKENLIAIKEVTIRKKMHHKELLETMETHEFYIGNSISDGTPNTMIEAIMSGCIPIQSNPGNATAEIIEDTVNGYLIEYPEDVNHIMQVIKKAIENRISKKGIIHNEDLINNRFNREVVTREVLKAYHTIK